MPILDFVDSKLVAFIDATSRDEALETLIDALDKEGKLKDKELFSQAIMQREKIVSTGIGMGVAIPHAKLEGYEDFFLIVGIQRNAGIEWDSIDGGPVRIIFMIGGPDQKQNEYLNILSQLTSIIKDEALRKKLLKSLNVQEVSELIMRCL